MNKHIKRTLPSIIQEIQVMVSQSEESLDKLKTEIKLGVYANEQLIEEVSTNFMGPVK